MNTLTFLVEVVFGLYLSVVLIRLWLHSVRADFYNPFSQMIAKLTSPVVAPMQKIVPSIGRFDTATFLFAYVVAGAKCAAVMLINGALLPWVSVSILALFVVLKQLGVLLFWFLIARVILSWVHRGYHPFESVLHELTEPMLVPVRRIVPSMGGLDLSVLVLFIALQALNYLMSDLIPVWGRL